MEYDLMIPQEVLEEIEKVFRDGKITHPEDNWKDLPAIGHLSHYMNHFERWCDRKIYDDNSGSPALAHMIVRLIMMRYIEMHEEEEDGQK